MNTSSPDFGFDALDRYRLSVEDVLARHHTSVADEVLERFFDHVITKFEHGADAKECAVSWLLRLDDLEGGCRAAR